jgi:hypothetical protein
MEKPHSVLAPAWQVLLPPALVVAVHLVVWLTGGYDALPRLDVIMHLLGGFLAASVLAWTIDWSAARGWIREVDRRVAAVTVFGLVTVVAVVWEFAEFLADQLFQTGYQHGLGDTLRDIALGMLGGVAFLVVARRRRRQDPQASTRWDTPVSDARSQAGGHDATVKASSRDGVG